MPPCARTIRSFALAACLCVGAPASANDAQKLTNIRRRLTVNDTKVQASAINDLVEIDSARAIDVLERYIRRNVIELEKSGKQMEKLEANFNKKFDRWLDLWYSRQRGSVKEDNLYREAMFAERRFDTAASNLRVDYWRFVLGARAFPRFRSEKAIAQIEKGAATEVNPLLRQFYITGLAHESRSRSTPTLIELTKSKDPRVRAMAIRSLRNFAQKPGVAEAVRELLLDPAWPVRRGLYEFLANAPLRVAAPLLVAAGERETGEMALTVFAYLRHVTKTRVSDSGPAWRAWFEANRDTIERGIYIEPDEDAARGPLTDESKTVSTFFKIPIDSTRIVFVIDVSGSMTAEMTLADTHTNKIIDKYRLPHTRIGYAKAELIRALGSLRDGTYFNIVTYSDRAKALSSRMVEAKKISRGRAIRWVNQLKTGIETNIYAALDLCFKRYFLSGGKRRFLDLPDTIIFLTDGNATRGRFQVTKDLVSLVGIWNDPLDCVIHCVGIGKGQDRGFLRSIARATHGFDIDLTAGAKSLKRRERKPRVAAPLAPEQPEPKAREGE